MRLLHSRAHGAGAPRWEPRAGVGALPRGAFSRLCIAHVRAAQPVPSPDPATSPAEPKRPGLMRGRTFDGVEFDVPKTSPPWNLRPWTWGLEDYVVSTRARCASCRP